MKYLFFILLVVLFSCGKNHQKMGEQTNFLFEQVAITELPESHFFPFNLNQVEIEIDTQSTTKKFLADNTRNKLFKYYQNILSKLEKSALEINDLEWTSIPLLNIYDRETILELLSQKTGFSVRLNIPIENLRYYEMDYSLRVINENGEIVSIGHYSSKKEIKFSLSANDFTQIFLTEKWQLEIAMNEIHYKENRLRWSEEKIQRASHSFLDFSLKPIQSSTPKIQYLATISNPLFYQRVDTHLPLKEASITLKIPSEISLPQKERIEINDHKTYFFNQFSNDHYHFLIHFKQKNYKVVKNSLNAFVSYMDNSCQVSRNGELSNCQFNELRGSCTIEWESLEEIHSPYSFNEKELKQLSESIMVNQNPLFKNDKHSHINVRQQRVIQELHTKNKNISLQFVEKKDIYKKYLSVDVSQCRYKNKMNLQFIDKDSWLNNYNEEVYLKVITPEIEVFELYR